MCLAIISECLLLYWQQRMSCDSFLGIYVYRLTEGVYNSYISVQICRSTEGGVIPKERYTDPNPYPPSPSMRVAKLSFWSQKMRNVLKRMQK